MRTIRTSSPRSPSTNDGPRALVLSYGFQKRAITMLKRLTLVTLFLHVRKKGCPFEEGAIEVGNSAAIPPAQGSSAWREILEGQVQRSWKSAETTSAHEGGGKKVQRCCVDESLIHDGPMWSSAWHSVDRNGPRGTHRVWINNQVPSVVTLSLKT